MRASKSFWLTVVCYLCLSNVISGVHAQDASPPPKENHTLVSFSPTLSYSKAATQQQVYGGSAVVSEVRESTSYCDRRMYQFGAAASTSDTSTTAATGIRTSIDSNDGTIDALHAVGPGATTKQYLGFAGSYYDNNSVGLASQQTIGAQYQYYFGHCPPPYNAKDKAEPIVDTNTGRWFGDLVVGAAFMKQHLDQTPTSLNDFALPIAAQASYVRFGGPVPQGKGARYGPKFLLYFGAGYRPVLPDKHAYQVSGLAGIQIPTAISWLTINLSETDFYLNNAPNGTRRNYQNGSLAIVVSLPAKSPTSDADPTKVGACYGGDKLQRLYCYDNVSQSGCGAPNIFQEGGKCSVSPQLGVR